MDSIKDVVKKYILEVFLPDEDPSTLTDTTLLIADGILDSLAALKLVAYLEEQYSISIAPHEVDEDNFGSITAIERFVQSKQ